MLQGRGAPPDGRKPLRGARTGRAEGRAKSNGASEIEPEADSALPTAGPGPGDGGFLRTSGSRKEIDHRKESRGINNEGINDTDKYMYRPSPRLEDGKGPAASPLSGLFIDQCLHVINSWLVNEKH